MAMQKTRRPLTFEHAMSRIIAAFSAEGAAEIVQKPRRTIYAWADPDEDIWPPVPQAALLDAAFESAGHGDAPLLEVYQTIYRRRAGLLEVKHEPVDALERVTETVHEASEAVQAYTATSKERCVTSAQAEAAIKEIDEAIAAFQGMRLDILAQVEPTAADADNVERLGKEARG